MDARSLIRKAVRRGGFEVTRYVQSVPARRQTAFEHYGIGLLVDVGANVGQYATEVRANHYGGRILSIEPVAAAHARLAAAAEQDPLWSVERCAVGAETGEITMHVTAGSIFSSPLHALQRVQEASPTARPVKDEVVPLRRLDDLVPEVSPQVAVKIDVQGFERDVLAGMPRLLEAVPYVELELSPREVYHGQMLMSEALEVMESHGFVLAVVENLFRLPHNGQSLQFNGVFLREEPPTG